MRRLFTVEEARQKGLTRAALRWGVHAGQWRAVRRGVFIVGSEEPAPLERVIAGVIACNGVASGAVAGVLLEFDSVALRGPDITLPPSNSGRRGGVRRRLLSPDRVIRVEGVRCTNALQTLLDLAADVDDLVWEQALESALRKRLTTIGELADALCGAPGTSRIRRVLALRPTGAPPTESLLETLMVQLAREVPGLAPPTRQLVIENRHGRFVARVDLSWPELGLFIELDGQHHKGQPVYDASRETAVVAATGWLCGRFTWTEVTRHRRHTIRRLAELVDQAHRRPLPVGQ